MGRRQHTGKFETRAELEAYIWEILPQGQTYGVMGRRAGISEGLVCKIVNDRIRAGVERQRKLHEEETMTAKKAVAKRPASSVATVNQFDHMIELAITGNADLDKLEKLMDMKVKYDEIEAEKALNRAIGAFQADQAIIEKDSTGHNAKYASLAGTVSQIQENMSKHGLSRSWVPMQDKEAGRIGVRCEVTHVDGGMRSAQLWAAADTSGGKNDIQAMGSTVSYLERYTLYAALGITSAEMIDDDGRMAGKALDLVDENDIQEITTLLAESKSDTKLFLQAFFIESIDQLPKLQVARAKSVLTRKVKEAKK